MGVYRAWSRSINGACAVRAEWPWCVGMCCVACALCVCVCARDEPPHAISCLGLWLATHSYGAASILAVCAVMRDLVTSFMFESRMMRLLRHRPQGHPVGGAVVRTWLRGDARQSIYGVRCNAAPRASGVDEPHDNTCRLRAGGRAARCIAAAAVIAAGRRSTLPITTSRARARPLRLAAQLGVTLFACNALGWLHLSCITDHLVAGALPGRRVPELPPKRTEPPAPRSCAVIKEWQSKGDSKGCP